MKSFTVAAISISAIVGTVSAQTTLTGLGIGPVANPLFQNQTLFEDSNAHPNYTESVAVTVDTTPSESWSWQVNVTDISVSSSEQVVNTVLSLTWPQDSNANSVCAVAINGAAISYKTNPSAGSCTTTLSGCIVDLSSAVSKGMISSDGTVQCGTVLTNITIPSSCSSYLGSGSTVNGT